MSHGYGSVVMWQHINQHMIQPWIYSQRWCHQLIFIWQHVPTFHRHIKLSILEHIWISDLFVWPDWMLLSESDNPWMYLGVQECHWASIEFNWMQHLNEIEHNWVHCICNLTQVSAHECLWVNPNATEFPILLIISYKWVSMNAIEQVWTWLNALEHVWTPQLNMNEWAWVCMQAFAWALNAIEHVWKYLGVHKTE